jgi:hypothetical protein
MENVAKLAQKERTKKREEAIKLKFGFNRKSNSDEDTNESD